MCLGFSFLQLYFYSCLQKCDVHSGCARPAGSGWSSVTALWQKLVFFWCLFWPHRWEQGLHSLRFPVNDVPQDIVYKWLKETAHGRTEPILRAFIASGGVWSVWVGKRLQILSRWLYPAMAGHCSRKWFARTCFKAVRALLSFHNCMLLSVCCLATPCGGLSTFDCPAPRMSSMFSRRGTPRAQKAARKPGKRAPLAPAWASPFRVGSKMVEVSSWLIPKRACARASGSQTNNKRKIRTRRNVYVPRVVVKAGVGVKVTRDVVVASPHIDDSCR